MNEKGKVPPLRTHKRSGESKALQTLSCGIKRRSFDPKYSTHVVKNIISGEKKKRKAPRTYLKSPERRVRGGGDELKEKRFRKENSNEPALIG